MSAGNYEYQRFTLDGSAFLERRLAELCAQIRMAVLKLVGSSKVEALVLGGGYGRGQGGVFKTDSGDVPYNDLEFYVFLVGNHRLNQLRYGQALQRLGDSLSEAAKLHVEFKIDSLEQLRTREVSIFSYDLVSGHRVLCGGREVFRGCQTHLDATKIPRSEATRLLLNRCSGLLLAKELLNSGSLTSETIDFISRNVAKAKLALGDALLVVEGQYHWDCLERRRRMHGWGRGSRAPMFDEVLELHDAGVEFKLHPGRTTKSDQELLKEHHALTSLALREWLWLENQRLKAHFSTIREYSFSDIGKCSEGGFWRNLLLSIRTFGAGVTLDPYAPRYPRERLLNTLPLLLEDAPKAGEFELRRHLQRQLRTRADNWPGWVAAYKQIWSCYA